LTAVPADRSKHWSAANTLPRSGRFPETLKMLSISEFNASIHRESVVAMLLVWRRHARIELPRQIDDNSTVKQASDLRELSSNVAG